MRHYVTIRGKTISGRLYLRGGARMYTRSLEDAAAFQTLAEAKKAAADLEFLLCLLPSRTYTVGTMSRAGGAVDGCPGPADAARSRAAEAVGEGPEMSGSGENYDALRAAIARAEGK